MKRTKVSDFRGLLMLVFFLFCQVFLASAQDKPIKGKVISADDKESLIGVTVVIEGTTNGTITDFDGNYTIKAPSDAKLVFSFIGFQNLIVPVGGREKIDVELQADNIALEEIVAIGYGVQKKKEVTGAVTQVKAEDMTKIVSSDFTKALQGQVAGVSISESSGRPGDQANVQIRGLGSINANAEPLYVVDGIPQSGNPNIPSEDIETVDILKDGASAAIYGVRASNGVIMITTKRAKAGQAKIDLTANYGIQNITSGTPLMDTKEFLYVQETMQNLNGSSSQILHYNPDAMDYNTDFVDYITNDNAAVQTYNLTVSGGSETLSFTSSTNYFNQDGILRQSGYDRLTSRLNGRLKKGRLDAFASVGILKSEKETEPWGLYDFAVYQGPYRTPLADMEQTGNSITVPGQNPDHVGYLARILRQENTTKENGVNLSANLKFEIARGLTIQSNVGYNQWGMTVRNWSPQFLVYNDKGAINVNGTISDASLKETRYQSETFNVENFLSYNHDFGKNSIALTAAYTIEQVSKSMSYISGLGFASNDTQEFSSATSIVGATGTSNEAARIGKLGRVQYTYDGRYMLSGSVRYDGSSKFAESNRYEMFRGGSLGWNISEESFMDQFDFIDNLKLRASYGELGNDGVDDYLFQSLVENGMDYVWGTENDDKLASGSIRRGYSNENVKWETNISKNIGLDLMMFNGKFTFNADYYENDKQDMLLNITLPASQGVNIPNVSTGKYNSVMSNIGNMTNKGIEFATSYRTKTKSGVNLKFNATFTKNTNEITNMGFMDNVALPTSTPGVWNAAQLDPTTFLRVGYEAGAFFLVETDGIFKSQEEVDRHVTVVDGKEVKIQSNAKAGDVKMIDANKDGVIDDNDRVYAGSGMADYEVGFIFNADYKGFDFSVQSIYSHGNMVYNGAKLYAYSNARHSDLYNMWTPYNPTSDIPMAKPQSNHDNFRSRTDYYLEDGSFLRIRNLSLGYTVPKAVFNGNVDYLRVYLTAQNPFTFTKYEGYDPEVGGNGLSTRGVDKGNYPVTRKFMVGMQLKF